MASQDNQNGWNEYSKLVLKELETLNQKFDALSTSLNDVKNELTEMKAKEDRVDELRVWKEKIDEIASPSQLQAKFEEVEDLKTFKTKAVTIFAVIQFLMATMIWASKIFA
jgi:predicted RNase H-like nuclease (RuvC/YqgF family)